MAEDASLWTSILPRKATILTQLSREVCSERLQNEVDGSLSLAGKSEATGVVDRTWARVNRRTFYRNDFKPVLYIRFVQLPNGTELRCVSWFGIFVTIFMAAWVVVPWIVVGGVSSGWSTLIGMDLFAVALIVGCRLFSRGDHEFLVNLVARAVNGRIVQDNAP